MKRLREDFGVTAWFGTLIILGVFAMLLIGTYQRVIDWGQLLPIIAGWVSGIVTGYIAIKARKQQ